MAHALAETGLPALFSYAGRTAAPVAQPLPMRIGGFGGAEALAGFLHEGGFTHVIDATHPFAAQMSQNACIACAATGTPLCALERPPWQPGPEDQWQRVPDLGGAVAALPSEPARIFLAIGKQNLGLFAARPQHHYLLRLVDPPAEPLPLPDATAVIARGPFDLEGDLALLRDHAITHIVAKNAGGTGARAKLDAARALALPVILIDRPTLPSRDIRDSAKGVLGWLADHGATPRGV